MYKIKSEVLVERGPSFENKEEGNFIKKNYYTIFSIIYFQSFEVILFWFLVVISKFDFFLPSDEHGINVDEDGDLILCRKNKKSLSIGNDFLTI